MTPRQLKRRRVRRSKAIAVKRRDREFEEIRNNVLLPGTPEYDQMFRIVPPPNWYETILYGIAAILLVPVVWVYEWFVGKGNEPKRPM